MIAEAVFVGTELLLGQIVNTNAAYLGECLSELGIDHYYQSVVGDNSTRLADVLREAIGRADVVITSGGLGPTMDDLTRETVAELTHRELEFHADIWQQMLRRRPHIPENMKRQAMVPAGATVLPNDCGTAPGLAVPTESGKMFILLPGPPSELRPMFANYAVPLLLERMGERTTLVSRSLHFCEIGESPLEDQLKDLIATQTDPTMATYAKPGDVQLRISTKADSIAAGLARIAPLEAEIRRRLGEYIYGADQVTLEQAVGELLAGLGWRVAIIDAATGGTLSGRLTGPTDASRWFGGAVVASSAAQAGDLLRQAGMLVSGPTSPTTEASVAATAPTSEQARALEQAWALEQARAARAMAEVGVAVIPVEGSVLVAVATPLSISHTLIAGWRGNPTDIRWRISQSTLAFLRRVLLKAATER